MLGAEYHPEQALNNAERGRLRAELLDALWGRASGAQNKEQDRDPALCVLNEEARRVSTWGNHHRCTAHGQGNRRLAHRWVVRSSSLCSYVLRYYVHRI
jgi:hypothetical protein